MLNSHHYAGLTMGPTSAPVVLGSGSPRRRALLANIVPSFQISSADVDETPGASEHPEALAIRLALAKAAAVASAHPDAVVIGADTVVAMRQAGPVEWRHEDPRCEWLLLAKPLDTQEAEAFLRLLGGRRHIVITAVAVLTPHREIHAAASHSAVWLRRMSESEIGAYVATGTTMDKAGGYAIQDDGYRPVARIEGSETNVMGLPLALTRHLLATAGAIGAREGALS